MCVCVCVVMVWITDACAAGCQWAGVLLEYRDKQNNIRKTRCAESYKRGALHYSVITVLNWAIPYTMFSSSKFCLAHDNTELSIHATNKKRERRGLGACQSRVS